jgi:hypothetical protein
MLQNCIRLQHIFEFAVNEVYIVTLGKYYGSSKLFYFRKNNLKKSLPEYYMTPRVCMEMPAVSRPCGLFHFPAPHTN